MIRVLGARRIFLLLSLLGIAGFLAVVYFYFLLPQKDRAESDLRRVRAETMSTEQQLRTLTQEIEQFESQKVLFEKLDGLGFFNAQDRVLARERFEVMQQMSRVLSAKYEIKPAKIIEDELAQEAGYGVLNSEISVSLEAFDDIDIYRFVYLMNYAFPGHITISNLNIERQAEVTSDVLRGIGSGSATALISAKFDASWRTMAPESVLGTERSGGYGQ